MRSRVLLLTGLILCTGTACGESTAPDAVASPETTTSSATHPREREVEVLSRVFHVDQIFPSMKGPLVTRRVSVGDPARPELLWLTGYTVEVVGADGHSPESIEFECHTNLNWSLNPEWSNRNKPRIFTLTQGQTDVRLPAGFGMPMLSNESLVFNTQVLNLNEPEIDRKVAHRARVRYLRDSDLDEPIKPLIATNAQAMVSLEDESVVWNVEDPDEHLEGASCEPGEFAGRAPELHDRFGRRFTPHWVVPPGRHEYRTLVTDAMKIPYDTTVHFIGVHVHPHSESLELRDLTTGETVYKSHHQSRDDRLGLAHLEAFSSEEGIPVYADHHYELVSVYDNPTDQNSDAMAAMFIYYLDREFEHPLQSRDPLAQR